MTRLRLVNCRLFDASEFARFEEDYLVWFRRLERGYNI